MNKDKNYDRATPIVKLAFDSGWHRGDLTCYPSTYEQLIKFCSELIKKSENGEIDLNELKGVK